jgi:gas vesicle protein
MPRNDTTDFLAAFAVGTVLGIGATLLLRPERTRRDRLARQLRPPLREVRRGVRHAGAGMRESAEATGDLTAELISAGKELLGEFRSEVAQILGDAREEIGGLARERARDLSRDLSRTARKAGRKLGM